MRPLRYSINVTLDGCCDHRVMIPEADLHRHAIENLERADALLFGRVTYELMESAWRLPLPTGAWPDWMEPFARTIDAAKQYVVSSTLDRVDWNAELHRPLSPRRRRHVVVRPEHVGRIVRRLDARSPERRGQRGEG